MVKLVRWGILSGVYLFPLSILILKRYLIPLDTGFGLVRLHYFAFAYSVLVLLIITVLQKEIPTFRSLAGNWRLSAKYNLIILGIFLIISGFAYYFKLYNIEPQDSYRGLPSSRFVIFYVLISVAAQQYLVFFDLRKRLKDLKIKLWVRIIFMASVYSLMHVYYPDNLILLMSTFVLGIIWGISSEKSNSIAGNIPTHIIIGLISFYLNFA